MCCRVTDLACVCEPLSVCVLQPRQQARVVFAWTYRYLDLRIKEEETNSRARAAFQTKIMREWSKEDWFKMCDKIDSLYDELVELIPPLGRLRGGVPTDYLSLGSDAPAGCLRETRGPSATGCLCWECRFRARVFPDEEDCKFPSSSSSSSATSSSSSSASASASSSSSSSASSSSPPLTFGQLCHPPETCYCRKCREADAQFSWPAAFAERLRQESWRILWQARLELQPDGADVLEGRVLECIEDIRRALRQALVAALMGNEVVAREKGIEAAYLAGVPAPFASAAELASIAGEDVDDQYELGSGGEDGSAAGDSDDEQSGAGAGTAAAEKEEEGCNLHEALRAREKKWNQMIGKTQEKVTEQLGLRFVLEEATCEAALEKFANMDLKECYKFSAVFLDPPYNKNDRNFLDTDEERTAVFKNLAAVMAYPGVAFISVNQDRVHRVRAAVNKTKGLTMPDQAFLVFWKARENRGQPKIAGKPGYEHVCIVYSTRPVAEKSGGKKKKRRKKQGESGKGKSTCRESRLFPDLEGQFYKRFPEQRGVIHGKARQNYRLDYVPPSATERVIDPTTRKAIRPKSQKTVSWYEYFILKHSKCPGARIMDGFMGTAASAIAAVKCGAAKYVGVEPDPVVFAIARARLNRFLTSKSASEHQFGDMVDNGPEEQLREALIDTPLSQMNTSPPENLTVKQYCEMANVEIRNSKLKGVDTQPLGKGLYTTAALKVDRDEGWVGVYIWGAVESADGPGEEGAFYMTFTEAPTNRARIKINTNCPGMYVNSCAGTGKRANMEFVERADQVTSSWRCIQGKLLCDVDAGEELLVMYNGNFWEAPTEAAVELAASEKAVQGGGGEGRQTRHRGR